MLQIKIPDVEFYDERTNEFVIQKGCVLTMEHSLLSLAKWESKWHIPFLSDKDKTDEQLLDYYRCMTITKNVKPSVFNNFDSRIVKAISDYMNDPMTATWFNDRGRNNDRSVITAEILYYDMIALGIPFECEKWHLNRLLTLIRVVSEKSKPPKKMTRDEVLAQQRRLNAERRAKMKTKG